MGIFGTGGQRWASSGCPSESWVMRAGLGAPRADTMTNGSEGEAAGLGPRMCPAAPRSTRLKGRNVSWWSHEKPLVSRTLPSPSHSASDMLGETFPAALGLCMLRGLSGAQGRRPGACWWEASQERLLSRAIPREGSPDLQDPILHPPRVPETQVCPESAGALLNPEHRLSVGSRATWPHHRVNLSEPRGPGDMPHDHGQSACQASTKEEWSADLCLPPREVWPHGAPLGPGTRSQQRLGVRNSKTPAVAQEWHLPTGESQSPALTGLSGSRPGWGPSQGAGSHLPRTVQAGAPRGELSEDAATFRSRVPFGLFRRHGDECHIGKGRQLDESLSQPGRKPSVWAVRHCREGRAACSPCASE